MNLCAMLAYVVDVVSSCILRRPNAPATCDATCDGADMQAGLLTSGRIEVPTRSMVDVSCRTVGSYGEVVAALREKLRQHVDKAGVRDDDDQKFEVVVFGHGG